MAYFRKLKNGGKTLILTKKDKEIAENRNQAKKGMTRYMSQETMTHTIKRLMKSYDRRVSHGANLAEIVMSELTELIETENEYRQKLLIAARWEKYKRDCAKNGEKIDYSRFPAGKIQNEYMFYRNQVERVMESRLIHQAALNIYRSKGYIR